MPEQITVKAIVLRRTNYQESDKIVSFISKSGKISALIRGVRKSKSKLAAGVELFSVSEVTFIKTRGELARIIQAKLKVHYGNIIKDFPRMMQAYEFMKIIDKATEDETVEDYFSLLNESLDSLNNFSYHLSLIRISFLFNLLKAGGRQPNLFTDDRGKRLSQYSAYYFDINEMRFIESGNGIFKPSTIKILRLIQAQNIGYVARIKNIEDYYRLLDTFSGYLESVL
jgi:DNA repair protein RecO (recombination protein O)